MPVSNVNKINIRDYLVPELENLKAVLDSFHLTNTLKALSLLRLVLEKELSQSMDACKKK